MKLQIDFGNTRLKWRILNQSDTVLSGHIDLIAIESGLRSLPWADIHSVQICSVSDDDKTNGLTVLCDSYSNYNVNIQVVTNNHLPPWFSLGQTNKDQIGRDRVMAMLGAFSPDSSYCVIDAGTAVTADYVDSGVHQGGYITCGLELSRNALKSHTAGIGSIESRLYSAKIDSGTTTQDAVEHGLRLSLITFCKHVIDQSPIPIDTVFLTGGDAVWLMSHLREPIQLHEDLVFKGISRYFDCM